MLRVLRAFDSSLGTASSAVAPGLHPKRTSQTNWHNKMATWSIPEWNQDLEDVESSMDIDQVATRNSAIKCDLSVQVKLARSNYTGSKRLAPFVELTPVKSPLAMEGEVDELGRPGKQVFGIGQSTRSSDVDIPKLAIAADPLDLSLSEPELEELAEPEPVETTQHLATIHEDPELEDRLGLEEDQELPGESSSHMEEEPAPLPPADAPMGTLDNVLSMEQVADTLEPPMEPFKQALAEHTVSPEPFDGDMLSDISAKESVVEDKYTSTEDIIGDEIKPAPPMPEVRTSVSSMVPPVLRRSGARKKTTATSECMPAIIQARADVPWVADLPRRNRAAMYLERQHMAEGHDAKVQTTMPLPEDLMSLEGVQKGGDQVKKEEYGELFTKHSGPDTDGSGITTSPGGRVCIGSITRVPCLRHMEDEDDDDSGLDFDHLPIRQRMDMWKKREHRAIRKGLILIPKMAKQGRFPISAWM